ncbi:MAG: DUF2179 domain-containing protein [Flammeovirgaceae bacterium]|nr:DUF2179 domain-containing protein [Flammeovirgaceae bacterium]
MDQFVTETLGLSDEVFTFLVLPLLIFLARITDVSIGTLRIIYMLGNRKVVATILGFFEASIWLIVIRQVFAHLDNWMCYVAYPAGYASGIFIGMIIEDRIAYGKVIVRIMTRKDVTAFRDFLHTMKLRVTIIKGEGPDGDENIVFTVVDRERLDGVLKKLKDELPTAFYTVEGVKAAAETGLIPEERNYLSMFRWMKGRNRS